MIIYKMSDKLNNNTKESVSISSYYKCDNIIESAKLTSSENLGWNLNSKYISSLCINTVTIDVVNSGKCKLPEYKSKESSGCDVYANLEEPLTIKPMERVIIPTGLYLNIPKGFEVQVRPRSGLAINHGITLINTPGTIDSDFTDEVKLLIINLGTEDFTINPKDRIAQFVVSQVIQINWNEVDKIEREYDRGGGFGHTGR